MKLLSRRPDWTDATCDLVAADRPYSVDERIRFETKIDLVRKCGKARTQLFASPRTATTWSAVATATSNALRT